MNSNLRHQALKRIKTSLVSIFILLALTFLLSHISKMGHKIDPHSKIILGLAGLSFWLNVIPITTIVINLAYFIKFWLRLAVGIAVTLGLTAVVWKYIDLTNIAKDPVVVILSGIFILWILCLTFRFVIPNHKNAPTTQTSNSLYDSRLSSQDQR